MVIEGHWIIYVCNLVMGQPRSESRVYCKPCHGVMIDDGVFAFDLCLPGMMCKLDCPWVREGVRRGLQ